jgi:hypothetical protein
MATMTYDASENTGELTAEEQESLAVGEKMQQEEAQLLAGKYKDAEELEKAYIELQSKLGKEPAKPEADAQPEEQAEPEAEAETETDFFDELWNEAQSDSDEYSADIIEKLKSKSPTELAQAYLDMRYKADQQPESQGMSEADANSLKDMVGGETKYNDMLKWASTAFNKEEVSLYDQVMQSGDRAACFFAVQSLAQRYGNSEGIEGEILKGRAPRSDKGDVFKSQAALVRAMSDPKYDADPAYRAEVMEKLGRSPINF